LIEEVGTGGTFTIQPLYEDISYAVSDIKPDESEEGGLIPKKKQLIFKKVSKDLYLKDYNGLGSSKVYIGEIK
jgi:hypothetical protein